MKKNEKSPNGHDRIKSLTQQIEGISNILLKLGNVVGNTPSKVTPTGNKSTKLKKIVRKPEDAQKPKKVSSTPTLPPITNPSSQILQFEKQQEIIQEGIPEAENENENEKTATEPASNS